jgi:hypothetical protein
MYRRFGKPIGPISKSKKSFHLKGSRSLSWTSWPSRTSWPLKMGPIRCPETSVQKYNSMLRNIPEEHRSHLHIAAEAWNHANFKHLLSYWIYLVIPFFREGASTSHWFVVLQQKQQSFVSKPSWFLRGKPPLIGCYNFFMLPPELNFENRDFFSTSIVLISYSFLQENQSHHFFYYGFYSRHNGHTISRHWSANPQ